MDKEWKISEERISHIDGSTYRAIETKNFHEDVYTDGNGFDNDEVTEKAVHAVNCHDELVEALRATYAQLMDGVPDKECSKEKLEARRLASAALANAEKKS